MQLRVYICSFPLNMFLCFHNCLDEILVVPIASVVPMTLVVWIVPDRHKGTSAKCITYVSSWYHLCVTDTTILQRVPLPPQRHQSETLLNVVFFIHILVIPSIEHFKMFCLILNTNSDISSTFSGVCDESSTKIIPKWYQWLYKST